MEYQKPKIELYRVRTFSEKIGDTFDFIRESWRPLLKHFAYLLLPVSIVMAFFMNNFFSGYMAILGTAAGGTGEMLPTESLVTFGLMTIGTGVVMCVAVVLLLALVYALMRLYQARPERLAGLAAAELKPELKHCMGRAVRLLLASLLIGVLAGVLIALFVVAFMAISPAMGAIGFLLVYAALIAVVLPLALMLPIYMMEDDISIVDALQKSLRLGFATWGGIFAVTFVLGLIISALQTLTFLPWYVMVMVKGLFSLQGGGGGFMATSGYSILQYLACIWMCLGYLLMSVISVVGLTIQYGHASDKIDGTGVARKIEKFDELDNF